jgi:hypothetical protein
MKLAARMTSVSGSWDSSPCRHRRHTRTLSNWHSRHQDAATGHPLGPSTAQESQGEYLTAKTTEGSTVEDKTTMRTTSAQSMDESSQDRKEAIARPLGIPTKYKQVLKAPPPDRYQAISYALHSALQRCPGRRMKMML